MSPFLAFLVEFTLRAAVVLALAWGADRLAVRWRWPACTRHWLWSLSLAVVVTLPLLVTFLPSVGLPLLPAAEMIETGPASPGASGGVLTGSAAPAAQATPGRIALPASTANERSAGNPIGVAFAGEDEMSAGMTPVSTWRSMGAAAAGRLFAPFLVSIWLAGALLLLGRLLGELGLLRHRAADAAPFPQADRIARDLAPVQARLRIGLSRHVRTPLTFGLRRPVILFPDDARRWSVERLRVVLLHELAHIARRDHATNLVALVARAVGWHLPLTWLAVRRLHLTREMACDDRVLHHGSSGEDYATHLIEIARQMPRRALPAEGSAVCMACNDLRVRLGAVLDGERLREPLARTGMLMATLLVVTVSIPVASMHPERRLATLDRLMEMLQRPGITARLAALEGLERHGDRESFQEVLAHRNDFEPEARAATLEALRAIGCRPAFIAIAGTLDDPDPGVRETAARNLASFDAPLARRSLPDLFAEQHWTSKDALLRTVGRPEGGTVLDLLRRTARDDVPEVRAAARATLQRLGERP